MSARIAARAGVSAVVSVITLFVTSATARATDPCSLIHGPALQYCQQGNSKAGSSGVTVPSGPTSVLDPLQALASAIAKCASWVVTQVSNAVGVTSDVDFANHSFVTTYAVVFAGSTFLVLLIWLWGVIKRAIRGAPMTTAFGEAIGLLWVTVLASAFTPLVLYTVVSAVDGITTALGGGTGANGRFFGAFSAALTNSHAASGGGPFAQIVLGLVSIVAAGVVWIELTIRAALLYAGALLGTIVYAGLVDKDLWGRVRRWVGIMSALILVKPVIVIVLRLAGALSTSGGPNGATGAIVAGLTIIIIAIFASAMLFRMIPGMGDEIVAARRDSYDPASKQAAALITRPVAGIAQGINTHAGRDAASRPSQPQTAAASSMGGIAAHSTRSPRPDGGSASSRPARDVPRQNNGGGTDR